jgi:plastocyanin
MNVLDSRFLRPGDTFAQRFTEPGIYRYNVGIQGSLAQPGHDAPFAVTVGDDAGDAPKTHYVTVNYTDNIFSATPARLQIKTGDAVLWSTVSANVPGFAVCGQSEAGRFDSAEIHANGMYSHAFGVSGVIEWSDAHEPKTHGTIVVGTHPACRTHEDRQAYAQKLSKATLVMIEDGHARPSKVKVTVGQTVFFAVKSAGGISIVDKTLLRRSPAFLNPQPLPPSPPPDF